jgi:hypothetical protein
MGEKERRNEMYRIEAFSSQYKAWEPIHDPFGVNKFFTVHEAEAAILDLIETVGGDEGDFRVGKEE